LFGLSKDIEKFRELGATILAISADPPELTRQRYKKYGAFSFPVLSDLKNKVAQKYHTFVPSRKEDEEGNQAHGTFVIDRQGRIVWANMGENPFVENRTLLIEVHRCMQRKHHP
jgi:peroxiredoxin